MTGQPAPTVSGIGLVPNGRYSIPDRDLALGVIREAVAEAGLDLSAIDGLYMPSPRPWTPQGFFSTYLHRLLGLETRRSIEVATGGTSGGHAFHAAVENVRSGAVEAALVLALERHSLIETTGPYFDYVATLFDREFETPIGLTIPGVYAQSLRRYLFEYGIEREDVAEIVVKNRRNARANPNALFDEAVTRREVLSSRPIADPIRLYECPAPCDGAAAVVITDGPSDGAAEPPVSVAGIGAHHAASHLLMSHRNEPTELPAIAESASRAVADAGVGVDAIDVFEPYTPFPHIEAIFAEELGLVGRGEGVDACLDGTTAPDGAHPISPSGGCLGRGHPPMVTPLLNHVEAVKQLRGTASTQVDGAEYAMTTAEHGHVNGVTATVFTTEAPA